MGFASLKMSKNFSRLGGDYHIVRLNFEATDGCTRLTEILLAVW